MRAVRVRPNPGQLDLLAEFQALDPNALAVMEREAAGEPGGVLAAGGGDWRAVIDFERAWSGTLAAKQRSVRDRFGLSSARYHQLLDRALELPEALAYDPAVVGRLRRVREARRRTRSAARIEDG